MELAQNRPIQLQGRDLRLDYSTPAPAYKERAPSNIIFVGQFSGSEEQLREAFSNFSESIQEIRISCVVSPLLHPTCLASESNFVILT